MIGSELLARFAMGRSLPDPLPADPFGLFRAWFDEAHKEKVQGNPNAMTLATVDADGRVSARVVLCRGIDEGAGWIRFFTNYRGAKGRALESNPRCAATFWWDAMEKQVRIEGRAVKCEAAESDEYFAARPWDHKLGAWVSEQSSPIRSRGELMERAVAKIRELGLSEIELLTRGNAVHIPRPPHWGGFRIYAERVELWLGGPGRFHDRAEWTRALRAEGSGFIGTAWSATRLQP